MPTMTINLPGYSCRWAGGSFIAVWRMERVGEHVPDLMISLPDSLNRSRATRDDIERIAKEEVA